MTNHPRRNQLEQRTALCRHGNIVCSKCVEITDAGKRMSDAVNLIVTCHDFGELRNGWLAIRLEDGSCNLSLYDSRETAVNRQLMPKMYAYLCLGQCYGGMNPRDAQLFLNVHRQIYDDGRNLSEMTQQVIFSQYGYDVLIGRRNPYDHRKRVY